MSERRIEHHYLSLLVQRFRENPEKPVFRQYIGRNDSWDLMTYRALERRLLVAKTHWHGTLAPLRLKPLDIVGLWLTGSKFSDLVNAIAVSALGYTPQFFSAYFENISTILELLSQSGGKALIFDTTYTAKVGGGGALEIPHFTALDDSEIAVASETTKSGESSAPAFCPDAPVGPEDVAALFHSSGTTGGRPKIIPNTYKMLNAVIARKLPEAGLFSASGDDAQIVINTIGSLANIATFHIFLGCIYAGGCLVQSSSLAITPEEFVGMTRTCSLNRLAVYSTFLSNLIRVAKQDNSVKAALQGLRDIFHTGVALNKEDDEWAHANGLKVINSYSTTETGPLMRASGGSDAFARLLRPLPGSHVVFLPRNNSEDDSGGLQLYELVVPSDSDECPPPEFCDTDGYYHTKDLFECVEDGWVYRGRAGDWLKVVPGFCDTKNMEDIVRKACPDLVHEVVVVGAGRAFPCLVVESAIDGLTDEKRTELSKEIVQRISELNKNLFPHERVQDPRKILVVEKGVLPRTTEKGNVRYERTHAYGTSI
ncbi:acetyl-CoA synthetase-like protein [Pilatotrama ljubarskyi]|nr:acetyl-CoA synthetase-like protein [Pilatotrama ljubarskyi]